MKVKKIGFIMLFLIVILCIGSCDKAMPHKIYNETIGKLAYIEDDLYYIANNDLYLNNRKIFDNVTYVQEYNKKIYFISQKQQENLSIFYEYSDENCNEMVKLPKGTVQKNIIHENIAYVLINNNIYCIDMNNKTTTNLLSQNNTVDFCITGTDLYFLDFESNNISFDEYAENTSNNVEFYLFKCKLYKYNVYNQESEMIYEADSNYLHKYLLAPLKNGIVLYNPDKEELYRYKKEVKKIFEGTINNVVTDNYDNIYYSNPLNSNICKKDLTTNETYILSDNQTNCYGLTEKYIYAGDGEFGEINSLK